MKLKCSVCEKSSKITKTTPDYVEAKCEKHGLFRQLRNYDLTKFQNRFSIGL